MLHFIYELVDPRDEQCRYVGITINPNLRFKQHLLMGDDNEEKKMWLQTLQEEGLDPRMNIIEIVDAIAKAQERERFWVQCRANEGCSLTNITLVPPLEESPVEVLMQVGASTRLRASFVDTRQEALEITPVDWKGIDPSHYMSRKDAAASLRLGGNGEMRFIHLGSLVRMRKYDSGKGVYYHRDDVRDFALWIKQFYPELIRKISSDGGE